MNKQQVLFLQLLSKQNVYLSEINKLFTKLQDGNAQMGVLYSELLSSSNTENDVISETSRFNEEETRTSPRLKFVYDNRTFPANQTVLAVITDIAKQYTLHELRSIFPQDRISPKRKKLLIFATRVEAQAASSDYMSRYYMNNPLVDKDGQEFFVTNQWVANTADQTGHANFLTFIECARAINIDIQPAV